MWKSPSRKAHLEHGPARVGASWVWRRVWEGQKLPDIEIQVWEGGETVGGESFDFIKSRKRVGSSGARV